jgi:hypothetical protein
MAAAQQREPEGETTMPRRKRDDAVAERAGQILEEQSERRREAAQRGAQTRRRRREEQQAEAQEQAPAESATPADVARQTRQRVHADLLTVAYRGPLARRFRELAEQHHLSLAKLMQDALLRYEADVAGGYRPGTALAEWKAEQTTQEEDGA